MGFIKVFILILTLSFSVNSWAIDAVPGEIIVKMKKSSDEDSTHKFVGKASMNHKLSLKKSWGKFNIHQFKVRDGQSVDQAINDLLLDPSVQYAEPNYIYHRQSAGIEGAPLSAQEAQEMVAASNSSFGAGDDNFNLTTADIKAEEAWDILSDVSDRPIVAVIDSGVDYSHYVFVDSDAIWENSGEIPGNGIDDDGNGYIDDVRGWNFAYDNNDPMDDDNHGTHVAGIILGMTQDILKSSVDTSKIRIMPLKFLDSNGVGSTSDAIEAINYAVNNGAKVLNNSWGGGSYSQALQDAIASAYNSGVTFVAAAGNAANDNDAAPTYPASYTIPNVLTIAATNDGDSLASFSNFGNSSVHVASPGVSILSTLPNDSFGYSSGTSMSSPFVSGLAAMMIREKGNINGYQVKGIIYDYSFGVGGLDGKVASKARINAFNAIDFVQKNDIDSYQPEYSGSRDVAAESAAGGGCGMVAKVLSRHNSGKGGGQPPWGSTALLLGVLFAPVMLMNFLRQRHKKMIDNRREFPRYQMESEVKIDVGGKKLVGQVSSISLGGARIDTEAMLENGGIVTLSIESPDGKQQIQVEGKVVWSEEKKAYGVKFCDAKEDALSAIGGWTKALNKI